MGDKYIIELEDKPFHKEDGDFLYRVKGFNSLVFDMTGIGKLTPYTEPDSERVRKEAFEKGYSTAVAEQECAVRGAAEKGYQKGLSDAWEATRKIANMDTEERGKVFGEIFIQNIQNIYSAPEAIEKIREYEKEEIEVGDEVLYEDSKGVVIVPEENGHYAAVFTAGGERICVPDYKLRKTGKHYPEIANIVRELRKK